MQKMTIFDLPYYKESVDLYRQTIRDVESMKRSRTNNLEITNHINKNLATIKERLVAGKQEKLQEISTLEKELKMKYDLEREYVDPQVEILRRQDFDMKLASMSDSDLADYVETVISDGYKLGAYQFAKLKKIVEESTNQTVHKLFTQLLSFEISHSVGKEYELTEEYQKAEAIKVELMQVPTSYLFVYSMQEDEYELKDFSEFDKLLTGYNVAVN